MPLLLRARWCNFCKTVFRDKFKEGVLGRVLGQRFWLRVYKVVQAANELWSRRLQSRAQRIYCRGCAGLTQARRCQMLHRVGAPKHLEERVGRQNWNSKIHAEPLATKLVYWLGCVSRAPSCLC